MFTGKAQTNQAAIARVKLGLSIVAGLVGGACLIAICSLLLYRRHQKKLQTVFPAAPETLPEGCFDGDSSEDSDAAQSEYSG